MEITREQFERECKRRFGAANPERMRVALWESLVRSGADPASIRKRLGLRFNSHECGEGACARANPDWCFLRFGMSRTRMGDGRIICIAGEHEDFYDPDFCIYNDVVVLRPGAGGESVTERTGEVEIYGYPEAVFPPTDFHSATLAGERIYVIGRLGYHGTRRAGETPVYVLDTRGYRVEEVKTGGECPGWIHRHHAWYDRSRHAIWVRGGRVHDPDTEGRDPVNRAAHLLHLDGMRWELICRKEERREFLLECEDPGDGYDGPGEEVVRPMGVEHEVLESTEYDTKGISVGGVRVLFESSYLQMRLTVERTLPDELVRRIVLEVREGLERRTQGEWAVKELREFA